MKNPDDKKLREQFEAAQAAVAADSKKTDTLAVREAEEEAKKSALKTAQGELDAMKAEKLGEFEKIAKVTDAKIGAAKPEDKDAKRREAEIAKSAEDKADE